MDSISKIIQEHESMPDIPKRTSTPSRQVDKVVRFAPGDLVLTVQKSNPCIVESFDGGKLILREWAEDEVFEYPAKYILAWWREAQI